MVGGFLQEVHGLLQILEGSGYVLEAKGTGCILRILLGLSDGLQWRLVGSRWSLGLSWQYVGTHG